MTLVSLTQPTYTFSRKKKAPYHLFLLKFECKHQLYLVIVLVTNDDKHGPMLCFNTILNESSDSLIHLLPHISLLRNCEVSIKLI